MCIRDSLICEDNDCEYGVFASGQSTTEGCIIENDFNCVYELYCIDQNETSNSIFTFLEEVPAIEGVKGTFCWDNVGNEINVYGRCNDCYVLLETNVTDCAGITKRIPFCTVLPTGFNHCPDPPTLEPPSPDQAVSYTHLTLPTICSV